MKAPPLWSEQDLDLWRAQAVDLFRRSRLEEPLEQYLAAFDRYRSEIEDLLERSVDLSLLRDLAPELVVESASLELLRYLAGPPISSDDLNTLLNVSAINRRQIAKDEGLAIRIVDLIVDAIDQRRFPWVRDGASPSEAERYAAVVSSASLLANRLIATNRRHEGKRRQEGEVGMALQSIGWKEVPPRVVASIEDAPRPGEYCLEAQVGKDKADLLVRLKDRRLMPIECKVSNSGVNSIKRLNDALNKSRRWRHDFGEASMVPAAVLSGVFGLRHLLEMQRHGVALFWSHELVRLTSWVNDAKL